MTRPELLQNLRSLSAGTIADVIGSDRYTVIDRAITGAILYASEQATDTEIESVKTFADVLTFLSEHRSYNPSWCGPSARS